VTVVAESFRLDNDPVKERISMSDGLSTAPRLVDQTPLSNSSWLNNRLGTSRKLDAQRWIIKFLGLGGR